MDERLKLLFISASPASHAHLASAAELRDIDARIRAALPAGGFEIAVATAAQRSQLTHLLLTHAPDIVHFSGHGEGRRGILLEDERGNAAPVGGKALAALFSVVRGKPSIVVLNACSTTRVARAFMHIVDFTVAMNGPVRDISAVAFASAFYDALARGLPVPSAFAAGRAQLQIQKLPSKYTPELFIAPGALPQAASQIVSGEREERAGASIRVEGNSRVRTMAVAVNHSRVNVKG